MITEPMSVTALNSRFKLRTQNLSPFSEEFLFFFLILSHFVQRFDLFVKALFLIPFINVTYLSCVCHIAEFSPVFRLLDLATGRSSLFTGQYSMIVIGGSVDNPTNAEYFNNQQIAQYNVQNG